MGGLADGIIITHRMPASDYEEAFATAMSGKAGKVVLDWRAVGG